MGLSITNVDITNAFDKFTPIWKSAFIMKTIVCVGEISFA